MRNLILSSCLRVADGILLIVTLLGCSSKLDSEVQSIVSVPEYSDGIARAYYNTEADGSFTRGKITLRFAITPSEIAERLAESWNSSLSLEATYTKTKADVAGDDICLPILEASASDGKLTVTASAETINEAFFKKELSASVRLITKLDGIQRSSEYVPLVPVANMGTGGKLDIPDIYFKAYLVDNFDINGDGEISVDEALTVKEINIASSSLPIRSLSGIEHFTKLESLDCSGNNLVALDLKSNAALRTLNCSNNRLTALDLSDKLYLTDVDCSGNKIDKLVLTNTGGLRNLDCSNNAIGEINLHDSRFVSRLECYDNPVKTLILDNCEEIAHLFVGPEETDAVSGKSITITGHLSLVSLALSGDFTDVKIFGNNSLVSLDITHLLELENIDCSDNSLSELNCLNNTALKTLNLKGNKGLSLIDLRNNSALKDLNLSGLSIAELDLTAITQLNTLDITDNANLTKVVCPSQDWLCKLLASSDVAPFVDKAGNSIIGGSVKIDGLYWACWNVGYTAEKLNGGTYSFEEAQKACPAGWRTPTTEEQTSLSKQYSFVVTVNGMEGRWFSGSNGYSGSVPSVFLPYTNSAIGGAYWSSSLMEGDRYSFGLFFASTYIKTNHADRSGTYSVRCVKD